jgi:flagellar basal body rod protein FlgG
MLPGFYSAATGMTVSSRHHEVTAQNLAFLHHPGYRREVVVQETFESQYDLVRQNPQAPESLGVGELSTVVDFEPGTLHATGRKLDVALQGEGFFVVQGPEGPLYTRNGVFQVGLDQALVTSDGLPVQGNGGPITLPPDASTESLLIADDGTITHGGLPVGKLDVVQFGDLSRLERKGASLFQAPEDMRPEPAQKTVVVQGMRESSNVQAVHELVSLISASRHYEGSQRALQAMGESIERHINVRGGN